MIRLGNDFLSLFFPPRCHLCGGARVHGEPELCSTCLIKLPRERNYDGSDNNTSERLRGLLRFDQAYSFFRFTKKSSVQTILHMVKYQGNTRLGVQLGKWFASEVLFKIRDNYDILVPVPLHSDRLKVRGYNQCVEIAKGVSEITRHQVVEALHRDKKSETQTHLNRWQRFENTTNEFSLASTDIVKGHRVLLLDDIITTGATIAGSAIPLITGGAKGIIVAAVGLTQEQ